MDKGIPFSTWLGWDPDDRARVIAYLQEKAATCSMCGTAAWEWDPKQGGHIRAYEPVSVRCPGCAVRETASELDQGEKRPAGVTVELRPRNTPDAARRVLAGQRAAKSRRRRRGEDD